MLSEHSKQCEMQGIAFSWSKRLSEKLCAEAKSRNEGARPIAKLIDKNVRNMISDGIISGECCRDMKKLRLFSRSFQTVDKLLSLIKMGV